MSISKYIINIGNLLSLCGAFIAMHYTIFEADEGYIFFLSLILAIISMSMLIYSNFRIQHHKIPALGCFTISLFVCLMMIFGWGLFWKEYSLRNYGKVANAIVSDVFPVRNKFRIVFYFVIRGERIEFVEDDGIREVGDMVRIRYATNNPNINEIIDDD